MPDPTQTPASTVDKDALQEDAFNEITRVLSEDHPTHKVAAPELDRIIKRLLKNIPPELKEHYESSGKKLEDLAIDARISALEHPNAAIKKYKERPVILVSKGLWDMADSEDQIAAVISHELNHKLLGQQENIKIEEAECDRYTIQTLYNAGYLHDALVRLFRKFPEDKEAFISPVLDSHPTIGNRIKALEFQRHEMERPGKLFEKRNPTSKPADATASIEALKYRNRLQEKLDAEGYETADLTKKFDILARNIRAFMVEHAGTEEFSFRPALACNELTALYERGARLDYGNAAQVKAFNNLVDVVATLPSNGLNYQKSYWQDLSDRYARNGYYELACIAGKAEPIPEAIRKDIMNIRENTRKYHTKAGLLGNFEEIARLRKAFIDAGNVGEAEAVAKRFLKQYGALVDAGLAWGLDYQFDTIMPRFAAPKEGAIKSQEAQTLEFLRSKGKENWKNNLEKAPGLAVSWGQHSQWAESSPAIDLMLGVMRIDSGAKHAEDALAATVESLGVKPQHVVKLSEANKRDDHNQYNPKHEITGGKYHFDEEDVFPPSHDNRTARMQRRDAEERALLDAGTWKKELGSTQESWDAFVAKHKQALMPEIVYYSHTDDDFKKCGDGYGDPATRNSGRLFISAFLAHVGELARTSPDIYQPLVNHFYQHAFPKLFEDMHQVVQQHEQTRIGGGTLQQNHPYITFAIDNPELLEDRGIHILQKTDAYIDGDKKPSAKGLQSALYAKRWNFDVWKQLDFKKPDTLENTRHNLVKTTKLLSSQKYSPLLIQRAAFHNAMAFLEYLGGKPCTANELLQLKLVVDVQSQDSHYNSDKRVDPLLDKQIEANYADLKRRNAPLDEWIEQYRAAKTVNHRYRGSFGEDVSLFDDILPLQRKFEEEIYKRVKSLPPEQQGAIAEKLLYSDKNLPTGIPPENLPVIEDNQRFDFTYPNGNFRSVAFSKYLLDALVAHKAVATGGVETDENRKAITATVDEVLSKLSTLDAEYVLAAFANKVETQRELSFYMRDQLEEKRTKAVSRTDIGLVEGGIRYICADEKTRLGFIDFLNTQYTPQEAGKLDVIIDQRINGRDNPPGKLFEAFAKHNRIESLRAMHEHFWSSSQEARILMADQLLFPADNYNQTIFDKGKKLILERFFPLSWFSFLSSDNRVAHHTADAYFANSRREGEPDDTRNRAVLGALYAGSPPSDVKPRRGEAINQLDMLGPAGDKLRQSINSHPKTPDDIKEDTRKSKTDASPPKRWELIEWLDERGPTKNNRNIRIGKMLGCGSYGVTVELDYGEGKRTACTILRPDAASRAETEFGRFSASIKQLIKQHPNLKPLVAIIEHARHNSKIETNMDLAAQQANVAAHHTHGFKVEIDGEAIDFAPAKWVGHGAEYKETAIVTGKHFNDLPANSEAEQHTKWRFATAMVAKELYLRLAGLPSDHDRHGGQQRIDGNTIHEFDHGGQAIEAPSSEEKRLLAGIVGRAMKRTAGWMGTGLRALSFENAFAKEIDKAVEDYPAYEMKLAEFQRDMLAMQDYYKFAEQYNPGTMKAVVNAIFQTKDVDPVILGELQKELGSRGMSYLREQSPQAEKIKIFPVRAQDRSIDDAAIVSDAPEPQHATEKHAHDDKPKRKKRPPRHDDDDKSGDFYSRQGLWASSVGTTSRGGFSLSGKK